MNKLKYIGWALEELDIFDMTVSEIQEELYKIYKNPKCKWLFTDIEENELDDLVLEYLREWTNYFETIG